MRAHKRRVDSARLGRMAHADVFELGPAPRFLFALFGGSGVDEEEYELRGRTVIPIFDHLLAGLERRRTGLVLAHVTAPPDVPFARFHDEASWAERWSAHVLEELLEPWEALPYFVSGFSGGVLLALNGLHASPRCFGGGGLGADAVPTSFLRPAHWPGRLRLYEAPADRVCNAPENRRRVDSLVRSGHAEVVRVRAGLHQLADYATSESLGDLIAVAEGQFRTSSADTGRRESME